MTGKEEILYENSLEKLHPAVAARISSKAEKNRILLK